jgi:NAD(P)-dependent dehydrogenase (short-subunit alcohol dehydrogenase family)
MKSHVTALVTGAGRGIGRGIAVVLAKAGWSVIVNYHGNKEAAEIALAECHGAAVSSAQKFLAVQADVSKPADRSRLIEEAWNLNGAVDALVNNAGIAPRVRADILEADEGSFEELLKTNLQGPYFLTQAAAKRMLTDKRKELGNPSPNPKSIIYISSVSAEAVSLNRGEYCVSKAALSMAVKLWATRLAPEGISVFEVRPGIMATDMTAGVKEKYDSLIAEGLVPAARWGTPEDVGAVVQTLADGSWAYATGSVIHVAGGMHIQKL